MRSLKKIALRIIPVAMLLIGLVSLRSAPLVYADDESEQTADLSSDNSQIQEPPVDPDEWAEGRGTEGYWGDNIREIIAQEIRDKIRTVIQTTLDYRDIAPDDPDHDRKVAELSDQSDRYAEDVELLRALLDATPDTGDPL